jgi:hypothetical protein
VEVVRKLFFVVKGNLKGITLLKEKLSLEIL